MAEIYKGPGNANDYQHSLDFLNDVFFSEEENPRDFLTLLPKLYKKEYNHCENNLIVSVDGKWKGAVGLYFDDVDVIGNKLICGGIGNVAVGKDCRGAGYMQDCMQQAMNRLIERNADYSVLGGQRQRYGYFSFAPAGFEHSFTFNAQNLKHVYGADYGAELTAVKVEESDTQSIEFIKSLYASNPDKFIRPEAKYYDYLVSWRQVPYVFKDGNTPVGYCIYTYDMCNITEIKAVDDNSFRKLLAAAFITSSQKEIRLEIPAYEKEYLEYLSQVTEGHSICHSSSLTVLNWKKFIKAYFELKASYTNVCDGKMSFLIHGYKKDESFTICVEDGKVSFTDDVESPLELTHHEATALFFSLYSVKTSDMSPGVASWFPLHWYIHPADKV